MDINSHKKVIRYRLSLFIKSYLYTMKTYKVTIDSGGTKRWYNAKDQLHREDGPAVEYSDGSKEWYINGQLHREDGPAIEWSNGYKAWYINNKRHREDGPAIEYNDGTKAWYINGQLHREDGPAVEGSDGTKAWYINGQLRHGILMANALQKQNGGLKLNNKPVTVKQ